nr:transporter substrate-binding domain-containing protein [uncultured Undibacterium sp.]
MIVVASNSVGRRILVPWCVVILAAVHQTPFAAINTAIPRSDSTMKPLIVHITPADRVGKKIEQYYVDLLELSLKKTQETDGPFTLVKHDIGITSNRSIFELKEKSERVDVIWTPNTRERNKELLPIKISLVRGLNNYRIFLIRKEDQDKFHQISGLRELAKLKAGVASQWVSKEILKRNGLQVEEAVVQKNLITMLEHKRFDYFPLGIYEIWEEIGESSNRNIVVEDSIMLHYASPMYFFVHKENRKLADRIERGLKIALQDGSFDKLFFSVPGFKKGSMMIKQSNRKVFELKVDNPDQE